MRSPVILAVALILGMSLGAGAVIAFVCSSRTVDSGDNVFGLLAFFLALATVFGGAGAYLACRHIKGHAPLWAIASAIGTFTIVLPLASYPNIAPVINWIAGLAAACALIATVIAGMIGAAANSDRRAQRG